ncbi:MAG: nickel pincer cofactor biosynthesis protein LarC [Deferrisomatales bacterium]|nr:nickel pincer cofactor biosynthesis protein LarC [Deferrisomatales bacterium]
MSARILYLDAAAGVSGDMFVGSLIDAGADPQVIRDHISCLGIDGLAVRVTRVQRSGLMGTKFDVIDPETGRNVDEPTAASSGQGHHHGHHGHSHGHAHPHGPGDGHRHGHRHRPHRGLGEVRRIIRTSALPTSVAEDAVAVFELLGRAEAKVHGVDADQVHFHEVGALDAIADIVAAASAFHQLGVDEAWCSPVHVGCGTVRCAHGVLPVPAPATAEILKGVPVYSDGVQGELCTPTGAALVRHFCTGFRAMPPMVVDSVGYGAGTKDFGIPNLLRATLGRVSGAQEPQRATQAG